MGAMAGFVFFMINISVTGDSVDNRLIWLTPRPSRRRPAAARQLTERRAARVTAQPHLQFRSAAVFPIEDPAEVVSGGSR